MLDSPKETNPIADDHSSSRNVSSSDRASANKSLGDRVLELIHFVAESSDVCEPFDEYVLIDVRTDEVLDDRRSLTDPPVGNGIVGSLRRLAQVIVYQIDDRNGILAGNRLSNISEV